MYYHDASRLFIDSHKKYKALLIISFSIIEFLPLGDGVQENITNHAGREFLIFPGPGKGYSRKHILGRSADSGKLTVANYNERGTEVYISCPNQSGPCPLRQCVQMAPRTIRNLVLDSTFRVDISGITRRIVRIKANNEIVVFVYSSYSTGEGEMFLAFPTHSARSLYYFPVGKDGFFVLLSLYDKTNVFTSYSSPNSKFYYQDWKGHNISTNPNEWFPIHLQRYQVFVAIYSGFIGHALVSSKPLLVTTGAVTTKIQGAKSNSSNTKSNHMEESVLPVSAWGRSYVVPSLPIRNLHPGYVRILAYERNTRITIIYSVFKKNVTLKNNGDSHQFYMVDRYNVHITATKRVYITQFGESSLSYETGTPTLLNIMPTEYFLVYYIVKLMTDAHGRRFQDYYIVIVVDSRRVNGLCFDSRCGILSQSGRDVYGYSVYSTPLSWARLGQSHVVRHWDGETKFGLYLFATSQRNVAATTGGMGLPTQHIEEPCIKTAMIPDDGIDNDCDGVKDEENLDKLDDDGDGAVDEDVISEGSLHGNWGVWGHWVCPAHCGDLAPSWRMRQCNNPKRVGAGKRCPGSDIQVGQLCSNRSRVCNQECSNTTWGADCLQECPKNCKDRVCDNFNGSCVSCEVGHRGDFCTISCPRYHYGQNCDTACKGCLLDCHPVNGECLYQSYGVFVLLMAIMVFIFPTVYTAYHYLEYRCFPSDDTSSNSDTFSDDSVLRGKRRTLLRNLLNLPVSLRPRSIDISSLSASIGSSDDDSATSEEEEEIGHAFDTLYNLYNRGSFNRGSFNGTEV